MKDTPKKILMIDDDEDDFFLVSTLLRDVAPGLYEVSWAPTYEKGIAGIDLREHELYLVDYRLGQHTGIDVLRHFQQRGYEAPVIMLTGKGDYFIDNEAMKAGATDYLVKGELTGPELERAIRYSIMEFKHLQTIAENERKYYGIFEKSHDLILLADCDNTIIDVNPIAERKLQYERETFIGMNLRRVFELKDQADEFFSDICGDQPIVQKEYTFLTRAGQRLAVLVNASRLDEKAGTFLCVAEDITEKKREEQEKRLQEKFVISGRIARVVAHEVRNPLTNILLAVGQFRSDLAGDNDTQVYLDIIQRNCTRINQLVSELLESTRMMELHLQEHDIHDLLRSALLLAEDRLQLNGMALEEIYLTEGVKVMADDEKIRIALLNLLINAIEAMTPGKGRLTVSTSAENGKVYIRIADNGAGIPEENKTRMFDPFFTSKTKGSGLGLTSTQNIIINHRGRIEVDSVLGKGTVFTITLPRI